MGHRFIHYSASGISAVSAARNTATLLLCCLLTTILSACGSGQKRPQADGLEASQPISVKYQVQRGDSLVKIARRLTGDADNWSKIAELNGITKPELLQIGLTITVPDYMIPELNADTSAKDGSTPVDLPQDATIAEVTQTPEVETSETPAFVAVLDEEQATGPQTPVKPRRAAPKDWVFQASSLPGELEVAAELHPATANRKFDIERMDTTQTSAQAANTQIEEPKVEQMVRVVGTYYPKGVYSQPSYTSTLMMRVAPGTQMTLEQSFGDWLQIRTDKGSGYIRSIDAEIIEAQEMTLTTNG